MVVMGTWHIRGSSDNLWVSRLHPLDESKPHKNYFGVNGCKTRTKRFNLHKPKTIHFPGLTAKHGQELSAGHTRTKQKNAAHTPEVHPHRQLSLQLFLERPAFGRHHLPAVTGQVHHHCDQGVAHVLCCYLTLFITPKNIVRNG